MARIKLKHYVVRKGKHGYWLPTPKMQAMGFRPIPCGHDGPDAWKIAAEWEERYQAARRGELPDTAKVYPSGSIGDAFMRYRQMQAWKTKPIRTREDWERGWQWIEPVFADLPPSSITLEHLDRWYHRLLQKHGVDSAYRAMKTWRALYNVMASMKLCAPKGDPSLAIRRKTPKGRHQVWRAGEVVRFVKGAWRAGFKGLACIIAIAWDTSFSPVDVRSLTSAQAMETADGAWGFLIDRTKSREAAFGTLSPRTRRLIEAYVADLGVTLLDDAPIFRTRGFAPGPKGGRPRAGVPYTKDSLVDDFADVRRLVFGQEEKRRLMDMRRSGAVEANAGGAAVEAIAAKMGNSIDESKALQRTYMPVNLAAVRAADEGRRKGRKLLGSEQNQYRKLKLGSKTS